jgi:dTDP-glucose pyrophosphorylase
MNRDRLLELLTKARSMAPDEPEEVEILQVSKATIKEHVGNELIPSHHVWIEVEDSDEPTCIHDVLFLGKRFRHEVTFLPMFRVNISEEILTHLDCAVGDTLIGEYRSDGIMDFRKP